MKTTASLLVVPLVWAGGVFADAQPVYKGKTLAEWVEKLTAADTAVRRQAAQALNELCHKVNGDARAAVPALIRALTDAEADIRASAADALVS